MKAIYQPKGKAGEYSPWACNFYVGCSNGCEYCYCKKGILDKTMGMDQPQLKKCFMNEDHALGIFIKELLQNLTELRSHGLFFSFTTDPMLPQTRNLTRQAIDFATDMQVPVMILTKRADWIDFLMPSLPINYRNYYAFGFTLTGHDELEPNASPNLERIMAMCELKEAGFKTFASIEPIVYLESSMSMIKKSMYYCDLFKIGLMSGAKYDKAKLKDFVKKVTKICDENKIYFKDSLLKQAGIDRKDLPANCVNRDYNMF